MSNRSFACALLLLGLAGAWACWCDTAMLWDGAYQFCETLMSGRPFSYLSRFHSWVVWQPVSLLAPHTENYRLLRLLYGLPFCMAPAAGVALSWWVARRTAPHLALWVLFGVALAPLPGQIFMINDSIFQLHLFWPVLLAALLPVTRAQTLAIGALSLFQLSHPLGIGLCLFAAAAAAGVMRRWPWAGWLFALALAGWVKLLVWPDNYAASEATWAQVRNTFEGGVRGWPLYGLVAVWGAGALLLLAGWSGRERNRTPANSARHQKLFAEAAALLLLLGAGAVWIRWGTAAPHWRGAIGYRRWVAPAASPLLLALVWEARHPVAVTSLRNLAGATAALIFAVLLGTQSLVCRDLLDQLSGLVELNHGPWIDATGFTDFMRDTALEHWGLAAQVIMVQGCTPHTLLWEAEAEAAARRVPPMISLKPADPRHAAAYPQSWIRWGDLPGPVDKEMVRWRME